MKKAVIRLFLDPGQLEDAAQCVAGMLDYTRSYYFGDDILAIEEGEAHVTDGGPAIDVKVDGAFEEKDLAFIINDCASARGVRSCLVIEKE